MANVKVVNLNVHPYREEFRERKIDIPPGGSIEMEHTEAVLFLGTFVPPKLDHDDNPTPEGYKMLKIVPLDDPAGTAPVLEAKADPRVCIACKYESSSPKDLEEHMKANHAAQHVVDEEAEKAAAAARKGRKVS